MSSLGRRIQWASIRRQQGDIGAGGDEFVGSAAGRDQDLRIRTELITV